jgi:hypothetical protein
MSSNKSDIGVLKNINSKLDSGVLKSIHIHGWLLFIYLIIIVIFTLINLWLLNTNQLIYNTTQKKSWIDALYFTLVSQTGTGYGDITPATTTAKFFVILHLLITYIYVANIFYMVVNEK